MKGLLVLIRQLKLRVEREMEFRAQAGVQKRYLENVVQDKQETCVRHSLDGFGAQWATS